MIKECLIALPLMLSPLASQAEGQRTFNISPSQEYTYTDKFLTNYDRKNVLQVNTPNNTDNEMVVGTTTMTFKTYVEKQSASYKLGNVDMSTNTVNYFLLMRLNGTFDSYTWDLTTIFPNIPIGFSGNVWNFYYWETNSGTLNSILDPYIMAKETDGQTIFQNIETISEELSNTQITYYDSNVNWQKIQDNYNGYISTSNYSQYTFSNQYFIIRITAEKSETQTGIDYTESFSMSNMPATITINTQWGYTPSTIEVIDVEGLIISILTLPFTFLTGAFNLTLWPGTQYAINVANLAFSILAVVLIIWVIRRLLR